MPGHSFGEGWHRLELRFPGLALFRQTHSEAETMTFIADAVDESCANAVRDHLDKLRREREAETYPSRTDRARYVY